MSFRDIAGLVVCAGFYILPFAIIIGFALSKIIKSIKYRRKQLLSTQLFNQCRRCAHRHLGDDYLYYCNIANLGPEICNPRMQWCYREKQREE